MTATKRREYVLNALKNSTTPIAANVFATTLQVSRQIIVGDIALLRAAGSNIIATPRGYMLEHSAKHVYTISCAHTTEHLLDELYVIVDCGCTIINVIVEHPIYGEITGNLQISNRMDADLFHQKLQEHHTAPLCSMTNNIHLHTLSCPSEQHFQQVQKQLRSKGFLVE